MSREAIMIRKEQIAIIAFALWVTLVSVFMILTQQIDFEIFFVICLMGMLVILQLMQSNYVEPAYLRNIRYLTAVAIVMFGIIVAKKVLEILTK
jgi:hypothetical protein